MWRSRKWCTGAQESRQDDFRCSCLLGGVCSESLMTLRLGSKLSKIAKPSGKLQLLARLLMHNPAHLSMRLLLVIIPSIWPLANSARLLHDATQSLSLDALDSTNTSKEFWMKATCCCKEGVCQNNDGKGAVFSPNQGVCCRIEKRGFCGHIPIFEFRRPALSPDFCVAPQTATWETIKPTKAEKPEAEVKPEDLERGSAAHTVRTYCDLSGEAEEDAGSASTAGTGSSAKEDALVHSLVKELKDNSLDQMVKEIFSLFVCIRWAPSPEFERLARDEVETGQISNNASAFALHAAGDFIPLRCTRAVNVFSKDSAIGEDHFENFEEEMEALSKWYTAEKRGAVVQRLEGLHKTNDHSRVEALAGAFDTKAFQAHVSDACKEDDSSAFNVDPVQASTKDLLSDCRASKFWLQKLKDWEEAMPFTSFMSPDMSEKAAKPGAEEHVVVCFGKRVASQLHRRAEGNHLMTDQNMVGCHGFWEIEEGAKMLDRIVRLWRPPTCHLAALELDLKIKLMEVIVSMNTKLFDALPAMLTEEMTDMPDFDGKMLEASHGLGVAGGVFNSVATAFKSMRGTYVRLGQLLGNTVVKWVVCPVKKGFNQTEIQDLDEVLGTEDDLARDYAKVAYSKWTGEHDPLPGEECESLGAQEDSMQNLLKCNLGIMQESMPEPYKDIEFLCPARPLLPGKQQADILAKVHQGWCPLVMSLDQMKRNSWYYRGWTPQKTQYDVIANPPDSQIQTAFVVDYATRPDTVFHVWRTFAKVAHGCSPEEMQHTPRWCARLPVVNDAPGAFNTFLSGASAVGSAVAGVTGRTLEALNVTEKKPRNHMSQERFGLWMAGAMKGADKWFHDASSAVFGRASERYGRSYAKTFVEIEVNELMHAASFQSRAGETADSKKRKRFDRFAVLAPCSTADAEADFRIKYVWSEKALQLARKAQQKSKGVFSTSRGFTAELRAEAVLHLKSKERAWVQYFAHFRAAPAGQALQDFVPTQNPYLMNMVGAEPGGSGSDIQSASLFGLEAQFACGSRQEMHDLEMRAAATLPGSFADCVKKGVNTNKELRAANPEKTYFPDSIVIRVNFSPLSACFSEGTNGKLAKSGETVNPLYKTFMEINACKPMEGTQAGELEAARKKRTYRGMVLGAGLPLETLTEVLIEPEDFLSEIDFSS